MRPVLIASVAVVTGMVSSSRASDFEDVQFNPREGLPQFEYMEAPDRLPNYTPGARWGTQGDPIRTMQKPLSPEASREHLVTFPGFDISLFASEPDIIKPLWLAFDHRGRLWIAESVDYPNDLQSPGEGNDRLKIIEDTDGDGRADSFTIFADGLSIPTSFVFAEGGVIVVHSGRTELLTDTDGDDRADKRRLLFEGWGMNDTHATVSNLRYGFDNWIWGVVGYSGFRGTVGGEDIRFGQGIFRFKPDGSRLEFIRSSNNNTWGLDITEDNIIIGSTANGNASMYMPIPNRYYESVNGWSAARLESIATSQRFYPITDKVRQVDWHGQYTAGSGSGLYTARNFPRDFWNRAQFVAEPTGHLVGLFFLERQGANLIARNSRNMLASDDEWTSPIYAEVGPDGALWAVDWYNYIIQHNPTPNGFSNGKGNAYETPLRDKTHGRIYRIAWEKGGTAADPHLSPDNPGSLVDGLKSDNKLWRMHAQRLMIERNRSDIVPRLAELAGEKSVDELGLNPAAIHALWTMDGLAADDDSLSPVIVKSALAAFTHPSAGVRRAAAMVLPKHARSAAAILDAGLLEDDDAQVRMAAFLALADMDPDPAAGPEILRAMQKSQNLEDRWIPEAATAAAARNDVSFIGALLAHSRETEAAARPSDGNNPDLSGKLGDMVRIVTTHYAGRAPTDSIVTTLTSLKGVSPQVSTAVLDGLMEGWPANSPPALSAGDISQLESVMDSLPEIVRDRLLSLGERWQVSGLFAGRMEAIIQTLKNQVADSGLDDPERASAAARWIGLQDRPDVAEAILEPVTLLSTPSLSTGLINSLGTSRSDETGSVILGRWSSFTPAVQRSAISMLLRRSEWSMALLDAVENKSIARTDIPPEYWSQLRQSRNRRVAGRANRIATAGLEVSSDRAAIVTRLLPLAERKGDAKRGKQVFAQSCAVCHRFEGEGGTVGPELTGIASRDRADILLEILDPNRSVEANYRLWNASTSDGTIYSGRLEAESQTTIEILDIAGQKHVIQRDEIASLEVLPQSIMPTGFEAMPEDDLTSLLEYLSQPHE